MGRDKASLRFGPETLVERVVRLVRTEVNDIVLAAGVDQALPVDLRVVRDARAGRGPLPALVGAMAAVRGECAFVVACDTPLLRPALIPLLLDHAADCDGCVPTVRGTLMTTCAVYRPAAVQRVANQVRARGLNSLHALAELLRLRVLDEVALRTVDPDLLSFTPCNTPDEYRQCLALAGLPVNDRPPPVV